MADHADVANDIAQDTLTRALGKAPKFNTPSLEECIQCEEPIPIQRQKIGGVTRCIDCQNIKERKQ